MDTLKLFCQEGFKFHFKFSAHTARKGGPETIKAC